LPLFNRNKVIPRFHVAKLLLAPTYTRQPLKCHASVAFLVLQKVV